MDSLSFRLNIQHVHVYLSVVSVPHEHHPWLEALRATAENKAKAASKVRNNRRTAQRFASPGILGCLSLGACGNLRNVSPDSSPTPKGELCVYS